MARKQITDMIAELRSWLPKYDHGAKDYPTVLYRVLASAPGGNELEDMGYEPIGNLGWQELDQLGRVLETIQDKRDVEDLIRGLMSEEEEEEEGVGEMNEAPRHVRKHRRDEQKHGSFVVVISDGTQQRFNEIRSAHDWAFERLQPLPNGSTALFYRAQVAPGRSDTGAPWTEPFDALEKNEYGRVVKGRIPQASAGPFAHEVSESAERTTESHELALYTVNDGDIYRQTIQPIVKNLARKIHNGTYDKDLAINAWLYAADAGAKKYTKEFGTHGPNGSFGVFTKADRIAAAREIGEQYDEEVQAEVVNISVSKNNARNARYKPRDRKKPATRRGGKR